MLPLSIADDTWFRLMPSGAIVFDAHLRVLRCNDAALAVLRTTEAQMIEASMSAKAWPTVREDFSPLSMEDSPAHQALRTGLPVTGQLLGLLTPEAGPPIWLKVNAHPLVDQTSTQPSHVLVTLEDVTAWKQALDAARQDRLLFSHGPVVVLQHRGDPLRLISVSDNFDEVFSLPSAPFLRGEDLLDTHVHPQDAAELQLQRQRLLASTSRGELTGQFRLLDDSGRWRTVEHRTHYDRGDGNRPPATLAYWLDRTAEAENLRRLAMTLEAARTGTWDWIRDGKLVVDAGWANLIGAPLEELADLNLEGWRNLIHPEDLPAWDSMNQSVGKGEQLAFDLEVRMHHRAGRWVWTRARGKVLDSEPNGRPLRVLGTQEDISEAVQAEEERFLLSQVVEQGPSAVLITDLSGTIEYVNRQFTSLSGYTLNEVRGQNPRLLKSPLTTPETYADLWSTLKAGRPWYGEFQNKKKDGSLYWVQASISPIGDASGTIYRYVGQHLDITARKRVEEASRAQYRFQVFLTQASARLVNVRGERVGLALGEILGDLGTHFRADRVFLASLSSQGQVLAVHNGWDRMGSVLPSSIPLDTAPLWRKRIQDREPILSTGLPCPVPWEPRPVSALLAVPLEAGNGEPGYLVLEAHNPRPAWDAEVQISVTVFANTLAAFLKRVADELDLKKARQEADVANRAKSDFLAHMSHEIRTPMNGILGLAELALSRELEPEARSQIEGIKASGETLLSLVNDILDVSKIEAGRFELESIPLSLREVVSAALSSLRVLAGKKGLDLTLVWEEGLQDARQGDPTRLRQILINLTGNALKFTDRGAVTVTIGRGEREGEVRFSVRDTGPGVPLDRQGRLFQRYTQSEVSTSRRFGGTGLGLAICRELVDRMGGALGYTDVTEPPGALFWFSVPLAPARGPIPLSEAPVTAHRPGRTNLRVLVVEDNLVNQQVAAGLLRRHGVEPVMADNGAEALDALMVDAFDLVLMDIQMPVLDGLAATRAIRRGEGGDANRAVPVVAMTANAMQGDRENALDAGMDDYMTKPISAAKIDALLKKWDAHPSAALVFDAEEMRQRLQLEDEYVRQIVQMFVEDLPVRRKALVAAREAGQTEEIVRLAHTLKGTAANLVAQAVVEAAQELEQAARRSDFDALGRVHEAVLTEIDRLEAALFEFLR